MEIYIMKLNKIKLALGLVAGFAVAAPMVASAAADQEKAIADANNWAHHVVTTQTMVTQL